MPTRRRPRPLRSRARGSRGTCFPKWGADLARARIRMESLEHAARILLAARSLGRVIKLTPDQMHDLERLRGISHHGQTDLGY